MTVEELLKCQILAGYLRAAMKFNDTAVSLFVHRNEDSRVEFIEKNRVE